MSAGFYLLAVSTLVCILLPHETLTTPVAGGYGGYGNDGYDHVGHHDGGSKTVTIIKKEYVKDNHYPHHHHSHHYGGYDDGYYNQGFDYPGGQYYKQYKSWGGY